MLYVAQRAMVHPSRHVPPQVPMPALSRVMRPIGSAESADVAWPSGKAAETALGLRSAYATRFDVQDIADIDFPMRTPRYAYTHAHTCMYTCTEHAYTTRALVTCTPSRATHAYTQTHTHTHARTHARTHAQSVVAGQPCGRIVRCTVLPSVATQHTALQRGAARRSGADRGSSSLSGGWDQPDERVECTLLQTQKATAPSHTRHWSRTRACVMP
jgi:hypothetical protein